MRFNALPGGSNSSNNNNNEPYKTVGSLNVNAGLGYKFYFRRRINASYIGRSYIALQARYHFLNYNNNGGTDLAGHAYTLGLIYGSYHHRPPGHVITHQRAPSGIK